MLEHVEKISWQAELWRIYVTWRLGILDVFLEWLPRWLLSKKDTNTALVDGSTLWISEAHKQKHLNSLGGCDLPSVNQQYSYGQYSDPWTLVIPQEELFSNEMTLPIMSRAKHKAAISIQLGFLYPFPPDELSFDFAVIGLVPELRQVQLHVVAVPKKTLHSYIQELEKMGLSINHACPIDRQGMNLLRDSSSNSQAGIARHLRITCIAMILVSLIALLTPLVLLDRQVTLAHAQIQAGMQRVRTIASLQDKIAGRADDIAAILEAEENSPNLQALLADLSSFGSEETEFSRVTLRDHQLVLVGVTSSEDALLKKLSAISNFGNPSSVVTTAATPDGRRFSYRLELEMPDK